MIRGNLLVIPIDDALLYVEPLYLSAESRHLPELKRVIASYGDRVAMTQRVAPLLAALFAREEAHAAVVSAEPFEHRSSVKQTVPIRYRGGEWMTGFVEPDVKGAFRQ